MGHIYAHTVFSNMQDETKRLEIEALVDTGATFAALPAALAQELDLEVTERRKVETAAGPMEMGLAWAIIEVHGRRGPMPVMLAEQSEHALIGVVTLEILGLGIDPSRGELTEVNALLY